MYKTKAKFIAGNYVVNSIRDARFEMYSFFQYLLTFARICFPIRMIVSEHFFGLMPEVWENQRGYRLSIIFIQWVYDRSLHRKYWFTILTIFDMTEKHQINYSDPSFWSYNFSHITPVHHNKGLTCYKTTISLFLGLLSYDHFFSQKKASETSVWYK